MPLRGTRHAPRAPRAASSPPQRNHRAQLYPVAASCRTAAAEKNHTVQVGCILSDLRFLLAAKRIVLSEKSTFSFWAAWLSEATEVGITTRDNDVPAATKSTTTRRGPAASDPPPEIMIGSRAPQ
jgi:hypothetical protein